MPWKKASEPIPETRIEAVAQCLRVLGQPLRIRIVEHLAAHGETTVQTLADELAVGQQHMSWHLGLLHRAEILARRPDGRRVWYSLRDGAASSLIEAASRLGRSADVRPRSAS